MSKDLCARYYKKKEKIQRKSCEKYQKLAEEKQKARIWSQAI